MSTHKLVALWAPKHLLKAIALAASATLLACGSVETETQTSTGSVPADKFDLSNWNITLPMDANRDKKVDIIKVADLQTYSHPDFFFLDEKGHMVFQSPNKAFTTPNSSNARSELRQMIRGTNTRIGTKSAGNNFALAIHPQAQYFGAVGGRMEATLQVNHVALRAGNPEKAPAYSVVVGQIHAGKSSEPKGGYGYGNEPLKIYYKKWPNHESGSVFWTYEKNLAKKDPNRRDVAYPVWGNLWDKSEDPGTDGIALGEEFSYSVNVYGNIMTLNFDAPGRETVTYSINLANNVDAYGNVDEHDHPYGYAGDSLYFKAGAYNQCSTKDQKGFWYAACLGTGKWKEDYANGDYTSVSFSKLVLSDPKAL